MSLRRRLKVLEARSPASLEPDSREVLSKLTDEELESYEALLQRAEERGIVEIDAPILRRVREELATDERSNQ